jgi:hypothetical protein
MIAKIPDMAAAADTCRDDKKAMKQGWAGPQKERLAIGPLTGVASIARRIGRTQWALGSRRSDWTRLTTAFQPKRACYAGDRF